MPVPVYLAQTKAISIKGSADALVVRGLAFEDVTLLIQQHLPEITAAVEQYRGSLTEVYSQRSMEGFLASLLTGFPKLTAHLIAHAADEPDAHETVAAYPMGVQLLALTAIAELTMEDAAGLSDPSPALGSAIRAVLGALNTAAPSIGSTGPSVAP